MGTAPDAVKRPVDRFDQDRKVFLSGDYKEEQPPKAKTPHVRELKRLQAETQAELDALMASILDHAFKGEL